MALYKSVYYYYYYYYYYRALLETLLSYGGDAKKSQLTSALYYHDQADRMDSVAFDATGNSGLKTHAQDVHDHQ